MKKRVYLICIATSALAICFPLPLAAADPIVSSPMIEPCAEAHFSFGTAISREGEVLFTEFSRRKIQSWNPLTRRANIWREEPTPGMYGFALSPNRDVLIGLDLGDKGAPGKVLRIAPDQTEEYILENITRPRQITCDEAGNVYVVTEVGAVYRWDVVSRKAELIMTARNPVSGIAVASDGTIYVSEYGTFKHIKEGHYSRPEDPGLVKVRRPDGEISVLAAGFWRARGLALSGDSLYLCTEATREDHGNSGLLVRIDINTGASETILDDVDYPQFPSADAEGRIYFTLARDNYLVVYDPAKPFREVHCPHPAVTGLSVRGGNLKWDPSDEEPWFSIRADDTVIEGSFRPDSEAGIIDGWFELPAAPFDLKHDPLHTEFTGENPAPGIFELPQVTATSEKGALTTVVFPLRSREGQRWPMQNHGTKDESPAAGFSERPSAFRIYFRWSAGEETQGFPIQ